MYWCSFVSRNRNKLTKSRHATDTSTQCEDHHQKTGRALSDTQQQQQLQGFESDITRSALVLDAKVITNREEPCQIVDGRENKRACSIITPHHHRL